MFCLNGIMYQNLARERLTRKKAGGDRGFGNTCTILHPMGDGG